MKLRKKTTSTSTFKTASISGVPVKTWHAERNGNVWVIESEEFEETVERAVKAREKLEEAKSLSEAADNELRHLATRVAQNEDSDIVMSGYGFDVKVKRRTQFRWDTAKLAEIFAQSNNLPNHVKTSLSVDRRTWERLSSAEQNELRPALNVIPQKSAVNINRSS